MISCPPLTKHTAARSSRTRALVLHNGDKTVIKTFQGKIKDSKYNQSRNLQGAGQVILLVLRMANYIGISPPIQGTIHRRFI